MNHFESSVINLIWTKKLVLLYKVNLTYKLWYYTLAKILVQKGLITLVPVASRCFHEFFCLAVLSLFLLSFTHFFLLHLKPLLLLLLLLLGDGDLVQIKKKFAPFQSFSRQIKAFVLGNHFWAGTKVLWDRPMV